MLKNNMNKMNNNFGKELKSMNNNRSQQLANNGQISLSTLLNMKQVDMSQCLKPITVMHKIYSPISIIGLITDVCSNVATVDVTTKEGFEAFKKALKLAQTDKNAPHETYKTIWIDGYNKFTDFSFINGNYYVYYDVTSIEMQIFARRLSEINIHKLTVEEALQIQADMEDIVRAWQESGIDVSKDKDKVFILNGKQFSFDQFFSNINTIASCFKKNRANIDFGFQALKAAKKASKDVPNFKFQLKELEEAIPDSIGACNMAFAESTEEYLNEYVKDIYAYSDNSILNDYTNYAIANPELALVIKQLISIVNNAFRNEITIDEAILAQMRNYVYTKAIDLTIDKHEVIKIAISTAMSQVYMNNKNNKIVVKTDKDNYNAAAIKQLFPQEYIEAFIGRAQRVELTIVDCDDIEDGQKIEFVNGYSVEEGLCELEENFTGIAYEYEGTLVYDIDAYAFEVCNAFVLDKTYKQGTTAQDIKADADNKTTKSLDIVGEYAVNKLQQTKEIKLTGTQAHIVKADNEFLGKILVPAVELKGTHNVKSVFTLPSLNGQQQLAFVVLQ